MTTTLRTTVTYLRQRLDSLPRISLGNGCMMEQHRAHRAAAQALGKYLTDTYGARVAERHDTNRIRMHGITSSNTAGLHGAFSNWVVAAERKIGVAKKRLLSISRACRQTSMVKASL